MKHTCLGQSYKTHLIVIFNFVIRIEFDRTTKYWLILCIYRLSSKDSVALPKTFTTRKGALLLFSEDMAHRTKPFESKRHRSTNGYQSNQDYSMSSVTASTDERDLKTVDDLAKSILAYGSFVSYSVGVAVSLYSRRFTYYLSECTQVVIQYLCLHFLPWLC